MVELREQGLIHMQGGSIRLVPGASVSSSYPRLPSNSNPSSSSNETPEEITPVQNIHISTRTPDLISEMESLFPSDIVEYAKSLINNRNEVPVPIQPKPVYMYCFLMLYTNLELGTKVLLTKFGKASNIHTRILELKRIFKCPGVLISSMIIPNQEFERDFHSELKSRLEQYYYPINIGEKTYTEAYILSPEVIDYYNYQRNLLQSEIVHEGENCVEKNIESFPLDTLASSLSNVNEHCALVITTQIKMNADILRYKFELKMKEKEMAMRDKDLLDKREERVYELKKMRHERHMAGKNIEI